MSKSEFEELYGNKSRFYLVIVFYPFLVDEAHKQIGENELRRYFCLKPQQISFNDTVEEAPDNCNSTLPEQLRKYFQDKIYSFNKNTHSYNSFWPEDIDVAEKFLDKKFPEIRELFRMTYLNATRMHCQQKASKEIIDKLFLIFDEALTQIEFLSVKMFDESRGAFFKFGKSRCKSNVS
jgi:hypothetical protein